MFSDWITCNLYYVKIDWRDAPEAPPEFNEYNELIDREFDILKHRMYNKIKDEIEEEWYRNNGKWPTSEIIKSKFEELAKVKKEADIGSRYYYRLNELKKTKLDSEIIKKFIEEDDAFDNQGTFVSLGLDMPGTQFKLEDGRMFLIGHGSYHHEDSKLPWKEEDKIVMYRTIDLEK